MSETRFLLDEHIPYAVVRDLALRERTIQVFRVGDEAGEPSISTPDPELLVWLEEHDCLLVTNNRSTMPGHLSTHLSAGRHVPGILIVPRRFAVGATIDELFLIWGASQPDEYRGQIVYLPVSQ